MRKDLPTLTLTDMRDKGFEKDHFRIETLKNTIEFSVGHCLPSMIVQDLINRGWTINIKRA